MAAPVESPVPSDSIIESDKDKDNAPSLDDSSNGKDASDSKEADPKENKLAGPDWLTESCEESRQIALHLQKVGCCVRCILRLLGCHDPWYFKLESQAQLRKLLPEECWVSPSDTSPCPCPTCLGVLQEFTEPDFLHKIVEKVKQENYEFDHHQFSLILPVSLSVREKSVFVNLKSKFGAVYSVKEEWLVGVKDAWKWTCGPQLDDMLGKRFQRKAPFDILLTFTYNDTDKECRFLLDVYPDMFRRRKQRKFGFETFTRNNVEKALADMKASKFEDCVTCPPTVPAIGCECQISCCHEALFIAGRYQKYSRTLCQTPWFVNGKRQAENSVQELICEHILQTFKATDHRFSSSGREDVDVRTLGLGRPFIVELINCHCTKFTPQDMAQLQAKINCSTADVQVRDLQLVSRKDTEYLKEGETTKTKSYTALCWCEKELTDAVLKQLDGIKDLTLHQKTPLRVLHRRTAAVRDRVVLKMATKQTSRHRFELRLTTEAGTYIKEFVHGDFGRTTPNLTELLGADCDITGLDVESVDVDWPPYIDPVEKRLTAEDVESCVMPDSAVAVAEGGSSCS